MRMLLVDLRESARSLRKQPRFLIIGSLTLALGVGAVTSIFSVVNGVLFKPLPHPQAERLANIWSTAPAIGYDQFPLSRISSSSIASTTPCSRTWRSFSHVART